MENSELLSSIPASRSEYECMEEILEEEGTNPLHGEMVGQLLSQIYRAVERTPGLDNSINDRLSIASDMKNVEDIGDTYTARNWDGALRYLTREETGSSHILMIAVEVGFAQTYASLRAAISFSVCALRCRVGIAMCINEGDRCKRLPSKYYASSEEKMAAIQDTYPLQHGATRPDTLLNPTRSFTIVDDGGYVGGEVPANLAEIILGDCIPTHILDGNDVVAIPVNFFHQDWFEYGYGYRYCAWIRIRIWTKIRDFCKRLGSTQYRNSQHSAQFRQG
ncbi:hypothetical protein V1504DRAFT_494376 [Lipomyces starkeyi]